MDLTALVTAHAEGRLLRPTLRSITAALEAAVAAGYTCELLVVSDNADEATRREIARWVGRSEERLPVRVLEVSLGESGASRNAGALDARGISVALVDGDDLVSENYLVRALAVLADDPARIAHPQFVVSFGARSLLWRTDPTLYREVTYLDLVRHNLWPASFVTRREVLVAHPYRSLSPEAGYGPEDWMWNIDTASAGLVHVVAEETVFFYRVRERGGVNNRHALSVLPPFDFAALKTALPLAQPEPASAPARRLRPPNLAATGHRLYRRALPAARWATAWLSHEAKHVIYRGARLGLRLAAREPLRTPPGADIAPGVAEAVRGAVEIEPALSWTAHRLSSLDVWHAHDDGYAAYLEEAVAAIGDRGDALVMVPWVGTGGADLVSLNYARALNDSPRFAGRVTVLATAEPERTHRDRIPADLNFVQLDRRWMALDPSVRHRLMAQLVVLTRPELIVSVNCYHFTETLRYYDRQILDGTAAFLTLFAFDRVKPGYPVNSITDDSHREYLDRMGGVITDNTHTAALIDDILALDASHTLVHRQPALDHVPDLLTDTAAYRDETFDAQNPFRLLWPHRIDVEKRPDMLVGLATELRRRGLPVVIEVRGSRVLDSGRSSLMRDLAAAGVVYGGPYSGGLAALDLSGYHGMLLTSQSEGLPLVVVQSMLLSLPVIATDVGGVHDIVVDGETGLLAGGPDDIARFADQVEQLMTDAELRRGLIERGHAFAAENHSWESFRATVDQAFAAA